MPTAHFECAYQEIRALTPYHETCTAEGQKGGNPFSRRTGGQIKNVQRMLDLRGKKAVKSQ